MSAPPFSSAMFDFISPSTAFTLSGAAVKPKCAVKLSYGYFARFFYENNLLEAADINELQMNYVKKINLPTRLRMILSWPAI